MLRGDPRAFPAPRIVKSAQFRSGFAPRKGGSIFCASSTTEPPSLVAIRNQRGSR
jgi:hypothetical protein